MKERPMDLKRTLLVLPCLALLAGCGSMSLTGKPIDYKSAGQLPPLEVPPDLTSPRADQRYTVPGAENAGSATYSTYSREKGAQPQAGTTALLPSQDNARIERAGTQRWLVAKGDPETLWPVIKDFWQEMGFIIKQEVPEAGVMETDWAEDRAKIQQDFLRNFLGKVLDGLYSTAERDKFRTRLERGAEPGITEIYISHRGVMEVFESEGRDRTVWQPRPADPDLEAEMLRRLMVRLGVQEARAQAQLAETSSARAQVLRDSDGVSNLALDDSFDRAWRRVGLALDRVGFTVEDRDRSKGLYFVRYINPELDNRQESKGILSNLAFWRSSDADKKSAEQYRIAVAQAGPGTQIRVLNREGAPDRSEAAGKIVNLLYEQLK